MRYFVTSLLFLGLIFSLSAQDVEISDLEPRDLNPELLDLSEASFYFQGPVQVYVQDLMYGNRRYAAVLDYDGGRSVDIYAPEAYGAGMRPEAIDLSNASVEPNSDGTLTVSNAVIDGMQYAVTLGYTGGRTLGVTGQIQQLGPAPEAQAVDRLQQRLADAQDQIQDQEARIQDLRSGNAPVAQLQDRLEQRNRRVETLQTRVTALQTRVRQLENPTVPQLPQQLHVGFENRSNSFGEWARPGNTLEQTDRSAKFAKMVFPVRQSGTEFTYSVAASAPDSGWVGYGIHFLAEGAETAQGYGYGDSYLLWVTRDPRNQTGRGYVQLYQSMDDVHMIQVANAVLPVSNFDELQTTAYVNTAEQEIQVFLNGQYAFTFPANRIKNSASHIALRALGQITFTDLTVRGR